MDSWQYLAYLAVKRDLDRRDDGFFPVRSIRAERRPRHGRRRRDAER